MFISFISVNFISFIYIILINITLLFITPANAGTEFNCPSNANTASDTEYIVILQTNSQDEANSIFDIIGQCLGISVASLDPYEDMAKECANPANLNIPSEIPSTTSSNKSFRNLSIPGGFYAFSGYYSSDFVNALSDWDAVYQVNPAVVMNASSPINFNLQRRATQDSPVWNLDRIDQKNRPLNNEYIYPDCAGDDIVIYIVDTGIDITHPEFEGRAEYGKSVCSGCPPCPYDDHGHGTHVAGIAGSHTYGVAKKSTLIAVKVLNMDGSGTDSDIITGLQFVYEDYQKRKKSSIVNMSLGGGKSDALNLAVQAITGSGIHVVVAAGNSKGDACNSSPSSAPSAIAVGAVQNTSDDALSSYSNFGSCVPIYAPGDNVLSTYVENILDSTTATLSGTSMASPHVAGAIALFLCDYGKDISPSDMLTRLNSTCSKNLIGNLAPSGNYSCLLKTPPTDG
ncbi:10058_t:CDS:2 [Dentiscutata heterogama]|uniref:10058_t:CDS:1 n=1 Tax=Dentiscutata heterogama TaxID=1316150 RepID=A0ACA9MII5_9GLOM|nr:10058_t:CDS:2 [Dentiscutata heterogama]